MLCDRGRTEESGRLLPALYDIIAAIRTRLRMPGHELKLLTVKWLTVIGGLRELGVCGRRVSDKPVRTLHQRSAMYGAWDDEEGGANP